MRTGLGYDIHRLADGTSVKLGGVVIPSTKRVVAHSDGDLVFHALSNAVLSALGLSDIGTYFPDTSSTTEKMDSARILLFSLDEMKKRHYHVANAVVILITEEPRLSPYKEAIRSSLARLLEVPEEDVSVHANTKEKCMEVGRKEAIECLANVLLEKDEERSL